MLKPQSRAVAAQFWCQELGAEGFPANSVVITPHRADRVEALGNRIFCLRTDSALFITSPHEVVREIQAIAHELQDEPFRSLLHLFENRGRVVGSGPAYIGYRDIPLEAPQSISHLPFSDSRVEALKSAQPLDWEHFGYSPDSHGLFAYIDDGQLLGLAHYELWGERIAHIGVIVDKGARGRGVGQQVVTAAVNEALSKDSLPQYRTLHSNVPSMRIAARLGFEHFGDSLVIRLGEK